MYIQAVVCKVVKSVLERCESEFIQLVWFECTADNELGNYLFLFGQWQNIRLPKSQPLDEEDYFDPQDHHDSLGVQTAVSILVCQSISGM